MNKDRAGGLTGNTKLQVEGVVQQAKGKLETAWGKTKDGVHDAKAASVLKDAHVQVTLGASARVSAGGKKK